MRKTRLTAHIVFRIYDLQSSRSIWSAKLGESKENSESYTEQTSGNFLTDLLGGILESILGTGPPGEDEYPPAPDAIKVVRPIFSALAEALPGH